MSTVECACNCGQIIQPYVYHKQWREKHFANGHNRPHYNRKYNDEGQLQCIFCLLFKYTDQFVKDNRKYARRHGGVRNTCRDCENKKQDLKRKKPTTIERQRKLHLKRKYNLSIKEYDLIVVEQNGRCRVCLKDATTLHIDHDHKTGIVRGLLCKSCNLALGFFNDDINLLIAALNYLGFKDKPFIQ